MIIMVCNSTSFNDIAPLSKATLHIQDAYETRPERPRAMREHQGQNAYRIYDAIRPTILSNLNTLKPNVSLLTNNQDEFKFSLTALKRFLICSPWHNKSIVKFSKPRMSRLSARKATNASST